jgi:hypothetical protein
MQIDRRIIDADRPQQWYSPIVRLASFRDRQFPTVLVQAIRPEISAALVVPLGRVFADRKASVLNVDFAAKMTNAAADVINRRRADVFEVAH